MAAKKIRQRYVGVLSWERVNSMTAAELTAALREGYLPPVSGGTNTIITPSVIARLGLATLYNNMIVAGLVWRDFDAEFRAKVGDTITIRKPAKFVAQNFVRASGITLQDAVESSTTVVLNKFKDVSVPITSEELTLKIDDFRVRILEPMMQAIVEAVDADVAAALVAAATGGGGGGTATMDTKASDVLVESREKLTRAKMPLTDRYAILSPESQSLALLDINFLNAEKSGSTDALRNSSIGRVFGQETYESGTFGYGAGAVGQADGVAFHKTAVALASRPLETPMGVAPAQVAVESFQGITIRVVQAYDITKKQDIVSADILYGTAATRPEGAIRLDLGRGS